ncbi:hypothetical protein ACFR97_03450 [Haloplanus litoreus]|uniref:Transcriptional initiation protein Tat n=1 Tax=Haloplanus litoreus TaxID=767515 RepID=A0ABD6A194_9EURY
MDRRRALALLGLALSAGCASVPATGPRTPPTPGEPTAVSGDGTSMGVTDLRVEEAEAGHLRVHATVVNRADAERTGTVRIRVTIGEDRTERTREVTVAGGGERTVTLDFESVAYEDFSGNGSLQSSVV